MDAWRLYTSHLNQPVGQGDQIARWAERKYNLLIELVYLMGQSLGYKDINEATLRDNNYVPKGYADVEEEWHRMWKSWLEVLHGQRPFPMTMVGPVQVESSLPAVQEIQSAPQSQRPALTPGAAEND